MFFIYPSVQGTKNSKSYSIVCVDLFNKSSLPYLHGKCHTLLSLETVMAKKLVPVIQSNCWRSFSQDSCKLKWRNDRVHPPLKDFVVVVVSFLWKSYSDAFFFTFHLSQTNIQKVCPGYLFYRYYIPNHNYRVVQENCGHFYGFSELHTRELSVFSSLSTQMRNLSVNEIHLENLEFSRMSSLKNIVVQNIF